MSRTGTVIVLRRILACTAAAGLMLTAVAFTGRQREPSPAAQAPAKPPADSSQWIEIRNVDLHIDESHALHIGQLRGQVIATHTDSIAVLDDVLSYRIRVTSGRVALTGPDLATLLNDYVFAYKGAPIRDLKVRTDGEQIVISGIMHKGVDLKFDMTSTLSVDPDGRIRSHPTRMRLLGVNGTALLHALGLRLDKVLDLKGARGASVSGDDLLLEPTRIIPPPAIEGRLASIAVEGDRIVQTFTVTPDDGRAAVRFAPDSAAHNYIYFRGGRLRFGKLMMTDTDLLIVDADQRNGFDLFMAKYNDQLIAGRTVNLANYGLRVSMPDYAVVKLRAALLASRPR